MEDKHENNGEQNENHMRTIGKLQIALVSCVFHIIFTMTLASNTYSTQAFAHWSYFHMAFM